MIQLAYISDEAHLELLLAGDPATWALVEQWIRETIRFDGFSIPRDAHPDIVQDTQQQALQRMRAPGFRLRYGLRAFVKKIAYARCIDWLRRRRPTVELQESLPDLTSDPLQNLLRTDIRVRLRVAFERLSTSCQRLIRLHFYEKMTYGEIAELEDRKAGTMRWRMSECLKALRNHLKRLGEELP